MVSDEYVFIPFKKKGKITGLISVPDGFQPGRNPGVILAHGAGNDMFNPLLSHMAHVLEQAGYLCLRFNFPYRDRGRKSPDSEDVLSAAWVSVFEYLKSHPQCSPSAIVMGGKSLGGRIASQVVASGLVDAAGLIFLGYPLHAPGKKEFLRDAHFSRITVPMLFFAGTRDPFCDIDALKRVLSKLSAPCSLEIIEGGEHSFKMPSSSDMSEEEVHARILGKALSWLHDL